MKPFSTLFAKIVFWFFLNLILVTGLVAAFFVFQSKMDLFALFGRSTMDRMHVAGSLISHDLAQVPQAKWPDVLTRYSEIHQVKFALLLGDGSAFLSKDMAISDGVLKTLMEPFPPKPPPHIRHNNPENRPNGGPPGWSGSRGTPDFPKMGPPRHDERHDRRPPLVVRTKNPTRYWARIMIRVPLASSLHPEPAMLVAESASITGNGFFFDPKPWIIIPAAVILISVLFWIPLVRNITRPLARMTRAAEEIAKGKFDVRIDVLRADEIGRLGSAINHMTSRLGGFVKGQKRFLGDVAHELGSPIARIHLGLGILEQRVDPGNRERVADVIEDVNHMSNLVDELLSFSRAEMNPEKIRLEATELLPLVQRALHRETTAATKVSVQIDPDIRVFAAPELLTRALSNLIRNAVKYAGTAGPILVHAERKNDRVMIEVRDAGHGVPEDLVDRLFEPFFRPEASRDRESGGVGLGLAIVKTCIETCKGTVSARNLKPRGFAVTITLTACHSNRII